MFKNLLSNLPFNPGLIGEVSFYGRRLRSEAKLRRLGFIFVGLALIVQLAAVMYPAENSLATSSNQETAKAFSGSSKLVLSKEVENVTRNTWNANGSTVKPGDVLEFKLTTKNNSDSSAANLSTQDYLGRVLQYADLINSGSLVKQGLALDESGYLHWDIPTLKTGSTDIKTFRVKVKSQIPATNQPIPGSGDYDCTINNIYGNQVSIKVPCPLPKQVEQATVKLPDTGPGNSVLIGAGVLTVVGYFFARSRLLARELDIVRTDYAAAGGA